MWIPCMSFCLMLLGMGEAKESSLDRDVTSRDSGYSGLWWCSVMLCSANGYGGGILYVPVFVELLFVKEWIGLFKVECLCVCDRLMQDVFWGQFFLHLWFLILSGSSTYLGFCSLPIVNCYWDLWETLEKTNGRRNPTAAIFGWFRGSSISIIGYV